MNIKKVRQELRYHLPAIVLITALAGCATVSAMAKSDPVLPRPTDAQKEIHAATVDEKAPMRIVVEVAARQPTKPKRHKGKMITGGTGGWFRGVQGDDLNYVTDNDLLDKLSVLWKHKLAISGVTPATQKSSSYILETFANGPKTRMDSRQFVKRATKVVNRMHDSLDYEAFCARMKMDDKRCDLLEDVTDDLHGRDMVAYGMTELFPSFDGEVNMRIMNGVLMNAGQEFLNNVPAFGDPLLSKGLYQFTSYAVCWDARGPQGASIVNQFVKREDQIPQSVVKLSMDDQHAAAFLFTTYNVARWIKRMNENQMKSFKKLMPNHQPELIQYIAVSHHMPARTISYANAWLDRQGKDEFLDFLPPHLKLYAKKTKSNYQAVKAIA